MGSRRLPGKTLSLLGGRPVLQWVIERLRLSSCLDDIVVTTSVARQDNAIEEFCLECNYCFFRGSENDVLDRFYRASVHTGARRVVRVTADCPLIDPDVVDLVVGQFREGDDYVSNIRDPRTFPRGLDVEIFSAEALEKSWREDTNASWREHVDEYVLHHPELFKIRDVRSDQDFSFHRWTLDTPQDANLIGKILGHFENFNFGWMEVIDLFDRNPSWMDLNSHVPQASVDP